MTETIEKPQSPKKQKIKPSKIEIVLPQSDEKSEKAKISFINEEKLVLKIPKKFIKNRQSDS